MIENSSTPASSHPHKGQPRMINCNHCGVNKSRRQFYKSQLKKGTHVCAACIAQANAEPSPFTRLLNLGELCDERGALKICRNLNLPIFETIFSSLIDTKTKYARTGEDVTLAHSAVVTHDVSEALIAIQTIKVLGGDLHGIDSGGRTPLHYVSKLCRSMLVEKLSKSVNARDLNGETPLHYAMSSKSRYEDVADTVSALLRLGADCTIRNYLGQTVVHTASAYQDAGIVHILVRSGAEVELFDNSGLSCVYYASHAGKPQSVRILCESGADPNGTRTSNGDRPLHVASDVGNHGVVRVLVEMGAYLDVSRDDGLTAISIASTRGHAHVVRMLASFGACLHGAIRNAKNSVLEELERATLLRTHRIRTQAIMLQAENEAVKVDNARLMGENKQLKSVNERLTEDLSHVCVVCYSRVPNVVTIPCRHQVMCGDCAEEYFSRGSTRCPVCRHDVDEQMLVFR